MDGPGLPGRSLDEAACFERQDHLMHGGRRDSKVLPHFSLRRRTSVDLAVVINESQILTLFVRVSFIHGHRSNKPKLGPPFKRYSLREVIPLAGFHAFRHGVATTLIDRGASITTVGAQLRHSDPRITLGLYAHVVPQSQRDAVEGLASALGSGQLLTQQLIADSAPRKSFVS
jgi:hypothetical protein